MPNCSAKERGWHVTGHHDCTAISANPLSMTCAAIATPSRPSDLPGTTSAADLSGLTSLRLLSLGRAEFHYQFGMSIEQPQ